MLIERDRSCLLVVDVQEKLAPAITGAAAVIGNTSILMRAAARLVITEANRDVVHANLEHAAGRVMHSVGFDLVDAQTDAGDEAALAAQLTRALGGFERTHFAQVEPLPPGTVGVGTIMGVPAAMLPDFQRSMRAVLDAGKFAVDAYEGRRAPEPGEVACLGLEIIRRRAIELEPGSGTDAHALAAHGSLNA